MGTNAAHRLEAPPSHRHPTECVKGEKKLKNLILGKSWPLFH